jgi:hypothetical protein
MREKSGWFCAIGYNLPLNCRLHTKNSKMKKSFYPGIVGLLLFELANVYFVMPMPGISQQVDSVAFAYFIYQWRWVFRTLFAILIITGIRQSFNQKKWGVILSLSVIGMVVYLTQCVMAAEVMFLQPKSPNMKGLSHNKIQPNKLVLGIYLHGEARAYPIQFIGYHHQIRDSIAGQPIMVTYCTVCRTGRVYEPKVDGKVCDFRLVGMDHYNAMFEDELTHSWWRQATGDVAAGPKKGSSLKEIPFYQTTLATWSEMFPQTKVMQGDETFREEYDSMITYEGGRLVGKLTRRDTASWKDKSWVVGIEFQNQVKAYDWNLLLKKRIIFDVVAAKPIVVVLGDDLQSFAVFERKSANETWTWKKNQIAIENSGDINTYDIAGTPIKKDAPGLTRIPAYQEYWHSWQTFHPTTVR